jgi:hypothetical protein
LRQKTLPSIRVELRPTAITSPSEAKADKLKC